MLKCIGVRSELGKFTIADAISSFDSVSKKLEEGIKHCQADKDSHNASIAESQQKVKELESHIERGNRVLTKIKQLVA